MALQVGPIGPSSIGAWAITVIIIAIGATVIWLVHRHYNYAMPVYRRVFGDDDDPTHDGHLQDTSDRFDEIDDAVADLNQETDDIHDDVRTIERRQEHVLSNQKSIASALDVDLDEPHFYRTGRGDVDRFEDD